MSFVSAGLNRCEPVSEIHSSIALSASAHVASCTHTTRRAHQNGAERWHDRAACCIRRRRTRGAHTRCTSTTGCGGRCRSVEDIGLMSTFVQTEDSTHRCSCVMRIAECRRPSGARGCTATNRWAAQPTLRALRSPTEQGEEHSRERCRPRLSSAMQTASGRSGCSCCHRCSC